jgi:hypothetical protein
LGVEVEVLEGFDRRKPGGLDPQGRARRVAGGDFPVEDRGEVVLEGPVGVSGLVGEPAGGLDDPGGFERGGEVGELLGRVAGRGGHQRASPVTPNARS